VRRREFFEIFGSATVWSIVARAQQFEAVRRIGVLTSGFGPDSQARLDAFLEGAGIIGLERWRVGFVGVAITDLFHKQQHEDVVLVLRCVHAAPQFVARSPEGGIKHGLF
jgi:hypothetical protein